MVLVLVVAGLAGCSESAEVPEPEEPAVVDTDGDGVPDASDDCPGTGTGLRVDAAGCFQDLSVLFDPAATPSEMRAEDLADFVVDLSNLGQAAQEGVVLEILLPDGFTVSEGPDYAVYKLDGTPVRQDACPVVGLSVTCSIGTIGTDEGASAAWKAAAPFLGADTVLTTRAQIASASDTVPENDTDAIDVTVLATQRNLLYMAVAESYAAGDDIFPDFDDERRDQNKALSYPNRFLDYLIEGDPSWNPDGCRGDMTVPRNFNVAHSGDTVDWFVNHGHRDVALDCLPDLVTVSLGANDVLGVGPARKPLVCLVLVSPFLSSEETAAAVIEEAVEPFLAIGAQVIVVGYPDPGACPVLQLYAFELQRQIEALNNPNVAFVDVDAAFLFHHTAIVISEEDASNPCKYMAPAGPGPFGSLVGAHPNAIGHDVIASAVAGAARQAGFLDWAASRPFVSCLEPSSGISGSEVVIHGADFLEGASVLFGDISAAAVTVVDPYHVVATVPAGNELGTSVEVTVENPDGAFAVVDQAFQYRSLPDLEPFGRLLPESAGM